MFLFFFFPFFNHKNKQTEMKRSRSKDWLSSEISQDEKNDPRDQVLCSCFYKFIVFFLVSSAPVQKSVPIRPAIPGGKSTSDCYTHRYSEHGSNRRISVFVRIAIDGSLFLYAAEIVTKLSWKNGEYVLSEFPWFQADREETLLAISSQIRPECFLGRNLPVL